MDYSQRLATFKSWPKQMKPCAPELATANFVYTGISDIVKCTSCGLKLRNWERTDKAFDEHLRHAKNCDFIEHFSKLKVSKDQFKWQWIGHPPPNARDTYGHEVIYAESDVWFTDFQECVTQAKFAGKSLSYPDCFGCVLNIKVNVQ